MRYYLIVGEASGDLHASHLMAALRRVDDAAEFRFFGGDKMSDVGGIRVRHYRELAYMGFIPVLMHLPTIFRNMAKCKRDIVEWQPDVLILVDYPGFNLDIAQDMGVEGVAHQEHQARCRPIVLYTAVRGALLRAEAPLPDTLRRKSNGRGGAPVPRVVH